MKTVTMMLNEHLITLSPLEIGMLVIIKQMFNIQVLIRLFSLVS